MDNERDVVWHGSTVDAELEAIPNRTVIKEEYERLGGIPLSRQVTRKMNEVAKTAQDYEDAQVDKLSAALMVQVREQAHVFDGAVSLLHEVNDKELAYDALHGEGAWQKVIDRCTAVYNGEVEETEDDRKDPDYQKIMQDCETSLGVPSDFCVEGEQRWVETCQADLDFVKAKYNPLLTEYLGSFVRNAIRSAQADGIEIDHPEADNL